MPDELGMVRSDPRSPSPLGLTRKEPASRGEGLGCGSPHGPSHDTRRGAYNVCARSMAASMSWLGHARGDIYPAHARRSLNEDAKPGTPRSASCGTKLTPSTQIQGVSR